MKTSIRLLSVAGVLAFGAVSAHAKIHRTVEKTFAVQPGGELKVETQGGNIEIKTSAEPSVHVVAKETILAGSEQEADTLLKDLDLTIEQSGSGVVATAKYEKHSWGRNPVQVSFTVTVPTQYAVNLRTSGGNVDVADLDGKVHARTSGGNVSLGRIGGEIDAGTSGGDVSLEDGAKDVKLGTSGGNIRVGHIGGTADLDTSGGDISVKTVDNTLHASTSGGNVSAGIAGALKGDCSLSTSGGEVRVQVEKDAAFDLDASTSGGDVRAEGLTITIDKGGIGRSRLSGKVNGGGPRLKLRSSGGDLKIETR
jgi:DUF4097 and DUF4098 domain-containing protein YvlB